VGRQALDFEAVWTFHRRKAQEVQDEWAQDGEVVGGLIGMRTPLVIAQNHVPCTRADGSGRAHAGERLDSILASSREHADSRVGQRHGNVGLPSGQDLSRQLRETDGTSCLGLPRRCWRNP